VLRKIEVLDGDSDFQRANFLLEKEFREVDALQETYGDEDTEMNLHQLRIQADEVARLADARMTHLLIEHVKQFKKHLEIVRNYVHWVYYFESHFLDIEWRDAVKARQAVDRAVEIVQEKPSIPRLDPYLDLLFSLRIVHEINVSRKKSDSETIDVKELKYENVNGLLR
jgi:molecular chaperone DnaK